MNTESKKNAVSAIAVANFFITKARKDGYDITPMQLLKLVYIAHGWSLGILDRPLISNEIEAWRHGPVIPDVYHTFKKYRSSNITGYGSDIVWESDLQQYIEIPTEKIEDDDYKALLDRVWDIYKKYSGWELSAITHRDGTPWSTVWNRFGKNNNFGNATIDDEVIKDHYKQLIVERS